MNVKQQTPFSTDFHSDLHEDEQEEIQDYVVSGSFIDTLDQEYLDYLSEEEFVVSGFFVTEDQDEDGIEFIVNIIAENLTVGTIPLNSEPVDIGEYTVKFVINA
jgi:hypothetical protein